MTCYTFYLQSLYYVPFASKPKLKQGMTTVGDKFRNTACQKLSFIHNSYQKHKKVQKKVHSLFLLVPFWHCLHLFSVLFLKKGFNIYCFMFHWNKVFWKTLVCCLFVGRRMFHSWTLFPCICGVSTFVNCKK